MFTGVISIINPEPDSKLTMQPEKYASDDEENHAQNHAKNNVSNKMKRVKKIDRAIDRISGGTSSPFVVNLSKSKPLLLELKSRSYFRLNRLEQRVHSKREMMILLLWL